MSGDVHVRFCEGLGVRFPRATRLVICCRGNAKRAMAAMRRIMEKLKLTVNERKTRLVRIPEGSFEFLGYSIGRMWSPKKGRFYIGMRPSKKKLLRLCREISEETSRRYLVRKVEEEVEVINRKLLGWANYFCLGAVSRLYDIIDRHTCERVRRWLRLKHKVASKGISRFPDKYLHYELNLVRLRVFRRSLPWVKA